MSQSIRPSAAYLDVARAASVRASTAPRKLLILDLNGTLLIRPKPRHLNHRPIHPRPYMPTFRSYLFHQDVKPWLDVMVWSSAQPHSVVQMAEKCFQSQRDELKAIWARDTLGLDAASYSRKVQTVKDLRKPWSELQLGDPSQRHAAETTLLLDDSALKAHLQPYNHLCIPEYTQNMRNRDLATKAEEERRVAKSGRTGYDSTLIAVIGILDEVKKQTNVAGWIHAGGVWAGHAPPPADSDSSLELFSDKSSNSDTSPLKQSGKKAEPNPGNDAVWGEMQTMWFDNEPCFHHWEDRGKQVLEHLGIPLDHGIMTDGFSKKGTVMGIIL